MALTLALLSGGCSWQGPAGDRSQESVPVAAVHRDRLPPGDAVVADRLPSAAAEQLLDDAQRYREQGDQARAASSIERAMRIDRGNPWLMLELARVRAAQGEPDQAAALLAKARATASGNPAIAAAVDAAARELQVAVPGR